MIEKDLSIGIIVQHNVPDFIRWKYEESPLLTVYSHCDRVIVIVLIQLYSNPLSSTMSAINMLVFHIHSNPLSLTMNAIIVIISDECDCCILVVEFEPFEFNDRRGKISVFFADPFEPFEFDDECDYYISVVPFESFEFDGG